VQQEQQVLAPLQEQVYGTALVALMQEKRLVWTWGDYTVPPNKILEGGPATSDGSAQGRSAAAMRARASGESGGPASMLSGSVS
jgi:hypothetical protein